MDDGKPALFEINSKASGIYKRNKMKVLIVCGGGGISNAPFVQLQRKNLEELGVTCIDFSFERKSVIGYFTTLPRYWHIIKKHNPDLIHAHYGLTGLFALFQCSKPVIVSYIGTDLIDKKLRLLSWFSMLFTRYSVFVSKSLYEVVPFKKKNFRIIYYGIDLENFKPIDKQLSRKILGFHPTQIYCLFPSLKSRHEKNYELAEQCINEIGGIEVIEIGRKLPIEELNLIYNACDFMLLTSLYEGGPQVIFEALATNLPIVSTDVGVVRESISGVDGCSICTYEIDDVVSKVKKAINFQGRTKGRIRLESLNLDSRVLAKKIIELYESIQ